MPTDFGNELSALAARLTVLAGRGCQTFSCGHSGWSVSFVKLRTIINIPISGGMSSLATN
ncbi:hypothetical protein NSND_60968 [Nitrospira sp. ND1]|nr:hypothetical protein NSND_60968 [Nitrospira sp. ND1]